jgi:hypothetical protein
MAGMLTAWLFLALWVFTPVVQAADAAPCQGMEKKLTAKEKAELGRAIARQYSAAEKMEVPSAEVMCVFASGDWSIIRALPYAAEPLYFFYRGNPLTNSYVTSWYGIVMPEDEPEVKKWALENVPGIPPKLAACFARYVTQGH